VVLLEDQDRSLWDATLIAEGRALVDRAFASGQAGSYSLQAAIVAVHTEATEAAATDWAKIIGLYDRLGQMEPSPVVELNRAVAVAMQTGPAAGLALVDAILKGGYLANYHFAYSVRAELCRRLGRTAEARTAYERALSLAHQEPERRFLERRLAELAA
jgi:RNA polymerase sigma-70 factor (ECF subfamily)